MSLFIGKDNNDNNNLIITSDTISLLDIKDVDSLTNIVFNYSLPFLTCIEFTPISINQVNDDYFDLVGVEFSTDDITIIQDRYNNAVNGTPVIIISFLGNVLGGYQWIYNNSTFIFDWLDGYEFSSSPNPQTFSRIPDSTYRFKAIRSDVSIDGLVPDDIKLYLMNIDMDDINNTIIYPFIDVNTNIKFTNNTIFINGVDITSSNIVSFKDITNSSKINTFNAEYDKVSLPISILNTTSDTCKLVANSSEIYIENTNGERVFDTSIGSIHINDIYQFECYNDTDWTRYYTFITDDNSKAMLNDYIINENTIVLLTMYFDRYNTQTSEVEKASMATIWCATGDDLYLYTNIISSSGDTADYYIHWEEIDGIGRIVCTVIVSGSGDVPILNLSGIIKLG